MWFNNQETRRYLSRVMKILLFSNNIWRNYYYFCLSKPSEKKGNKKDWSARFRICFLSEREKNHCLLTFAFFHGNIITPYCCSLIVGKRNINFSFLLAGLNQLEVKNSKIVKMLFFSSSVVIGFLLQHCTASRRVLIFCAQRVKSGSKNLNQLQTTF